MLIEHVEDSIVQQTTLLVPTGEDRKPSSSVSRGSLSHTAAGTAINILKLERPTQFEKSFI